MVLNERVFRRGRETRPLPLLMAVGTSNRLPEDDALGALFDRFLLRVRCDNVAPERMQDVLIAGWKLDLGRVEPAATFSVEDVRRLNAMLARGRSDRRAAGLRRTDPSPAAMPGFRFPTAAR